MPAPPPWYYKQKRTAFSPSILFRTCCWLSLGSCLVLLHAFDVATKGDQLFVFIDVNLHVFEAGVVQSLGDLVFHVRSVGFIGIAADAEGEEQRRHGNHNALKTHTILPFRSGVRI